ncbi:MAG: LysR family transcriptional regulator [Pseudomonadota bacterium]
MDKLTSMRVFTRVAKAGSFAAAARELGISRAMVTKHVMQLENSLGVRLLNRTTRSLSLTEVGASYLERCLQIISDLEETELAVTHLQTEPRGTLKVHAPPFLGSSHIAPAVADYLEVYRDVKVDMILQGGPGAIIEEGVDVAICLGELNDSSLIARKLASSPSVVCGSAAYFEKYGAPQAPEDLKNHSCLVNWAMPPRDLWGFVGPKGDSSIRVTGRMQANVADPLRIAATKGLGLVLLPTYILGRDLQRGRLRVVLGDYRPPSMEINAVYPHRKYLSAKVRTFIDFLQGALRESLSWDGQLPPGEAE